MVLRPITALAGGLLFLRSGYGDGSDSSTTRTAAAIGRLLGMIVASMSMRKDMTSF